MVVVVIVVVYGVLLFMWLMFILFYFLPISVRRQSQKVVAVRASIADDQ